MTQALNYLSVAPPYIKEAPKALSTYSFVFHVTRNQPVVYLHLSVYKPHTAHNSSICSDEGLTLEMSATDLFKVANLHYQPS